jgi:hypothetical protein
LRAIKEKKQQQVRSAVRTSLQLSAQGSGSQRVTYIGALMLASSLSKTRVCA